MKNFPLLLTNDQGAEITLMFELMGCSKKGVLLGDVKGEHISALIIAYEELGADATNF
jgi:hypothetical protein